MAKAKKDKKKKKYTSIGGQALMEGIMMRGPYKTVMCVRRADGRIVTETMPTSSPTIWNKIPLLRGIVSLIQSMSLGTKLLMRSAEIAIEDEIKAAEEEEAAKSSAVPAEETAGAPESAETAEKTAEASDADEATEETAEAPEAAEAAEETAIAPEAAEAAEETAVAPESAEITEETAEASEAAEAAEETAIASEPADITEETAEASENTDEKTTNAPVPAADAKAEDNTAAARTEAAPEGRGRKAVAVIGSILCLALGVYLFFFAAPEIVARLVNDIFPGILPQRFADSLAAYPDRWLLGTGIAVKVIILLLLFGLVSLFTGSGRSEKNKKSENEQSALDGTGLLMVISTILGFGLAILLFSYAPTWISSAMFKWAFPNVLPAGAAEYMTLQNSQNIWRPIIEGIIKIIILVVYMLLVSKMEEIRTLFRYHGAEHKTIFCYEAGDELTVENVRKYKRFHPRCGTSFLILMLLVGIVAGMAIKYLLPPDIANSNIWYPLIKIGLIPVIMGVGYELLKMCGKHDNILTRIIAAPGLLMQRITTKEPTDEMIECAIAAIKPVIPENGEDML